MKKVVLLPKWFVILQLIFATAVIARSPLPGDNIRDFSFFATTDSWEIDAGGVVVYNVAIKELDGGRLEPITMVCTGAPRGATCTVTPRVKTDETPGDPEIVITTNPWHTPRGWAGLMYASYRKAAYSPTPPGDYTLTLTGTAPSGIQHLTKLPIRVYYDE